MKIQITFKTPDAVERAVDEAIAWERPADIADDDWEDKKFYLKDNINDELQKFIKYGELVTIEIDTEAKTAIVIPVKN
jgi:hypothetical protein